MGQEDEAELRRQAFAGFTIDDGAAAGAPRPTPWSCTACPPTAARRSPPRCSTGPRSVVWRQAANRMHAMRGLLALAASRPGAGGAAVKLGKPQRQHRIARLLETHAVTNQAQLVELLADEGVEATQATVSRDLEEIGAVKVRVPGGETVYALPELPVRPGRARGPPAAGARGVGGRDGALGQPGRPAHAAGLAPTWWARPSTAAASTA